MDKPLAIYSPMIGALSEIFIKRHIEGILPNRTVVIAQTRKKPDAGHWHVTCPTLFLEQGIGRIYQGILRRIGLTSVIEHRRFALVKSFVQRHHVQVMLGEYLNMSFPYFLMAQKLRIPFFVHAHGADVSQLLREPRWQRAYLQYNQAAGVITMSQVSRSRLIELGVSPEKIHVVPYGVTVPVHPFRRSEGSVIHCLAVGRMVAKKSPILLLDAFRRAVAVCPNLYLDYVGAGPLFSAARQFVYASRLQEHVTLHGGQSHEKVLGLMQEADIFLQHSMTAPETGDEEGLPVAILEAMAYSLPVISTHHAGIPEAVIENVTGYLVAEGDCDGMADYLIKLAVAPQQRQELGQSGWQRARERFSLEQERQALLKIFGLDGAFLHEI